MIGNDRGIGGHSKDVILTLLTCHLHHRVMRGTLTHKNDKTGRSQDMTCRSQDNWLKRIWLERGLRALWNDVFRQNKGKHEKREDFQHSTPLHTMW